MRKRFIILPLIFAFVTSCNVSNSQDNSIGTQEKASMDRKGLAIEILSDYRLITYDRPLNEISDADFINSEVSASIKKSVFYRNRQAALTKSGVNNISDTLSNSEMIPFCANISESTSIFQDGRSEYRQETNLDPEINPLLSFHETEMNLSKCVSKVEIKDGIAITYNNKGEVLSQKEVPMPDYSEYLTELENAKEESSLGTKSGIKRNINWLRNKMAEQCPTKAGENPSYRIYEQNDLVILEQSISGTKADEGTIVKTIFSKDISKTYGYDHLIGGKLKVRCRHSFDDYSVSTKSINIPVKDISDNNPSKTVIEEISCLNDGTPMLKVIEKGYSRNTIKFNIK